MSLGDALPPLFRRAGAGAGSPSAGTTTFMAEHHGWVLFLHLPGPKTELSVRARTLSHFPSPGGGPGGAGAAPGAGTPRFLGACLHFTFRSLK